MRDQQKGTHSIGLPKDGSDLSHVAKPLKYLASNLRNVCATAKSAAAQSESSNATAHCAVTSKGTKSVPLINPAQSVALTRSSTGRCLDQVTENGTRTDEAPQRVASENQMPSPAALEGKDSTKSAAPVLVKGQTAEVGISISVSRSTVKRVAPWRATVAHEPELHDEAPCRTASEPSPVLATAPNLGASRIPAGKSATILTERRGFLRALAGLPFIGGAVALIGAPTAVAEPVTLDLLEAYKVWLSEELSYLAWEMASRPECISRYGGENAVERSRLIRSVKFNVGKVSGYDHGGNGRSEPSTRAALVLSTVGCEWKEGR